MNGCYVVRVEFNPCINEKPFTFIEHTPEEAIRKIEYIAYKYLTIRWTYPDDPKNWYHNGWRKELWCNYLTNHNDFGLNIYPLNFSVKYCEPLKVRSDFTLPPIDSWKPKNIEKEQLK